MVTVMLLGFCAAGMTRCDGEWSVDVGSKPSRITLIDSVLHRDRRVVQKREDPGNFRSVEL